MSAVAATPPAAPHTTVAPADAAWQLSGVAAEIAARLRASVGFIRVLILVAIWIQPAVMWLYAAAALLLPRGTSRVPRWSGVVALARFGCLFAVLLPLTAGGVAMDDLLGEGPALWLPLAALSASGLLLLLLSGRSFGEIDEARCRRLVLDALPVAAIAIASGAVMVLLPGVRAERVLAAGVVLLGVMLALRPRAGAVVPGTLLALAAVALAGTGTRLQGGVGDLRVVAPADASGTLVVERAVGDVVVDLSRVRTASAELTVRASVGIGDLRVIAPRVASVEAELHAGRGDLYSTGEAVGGHDVTTHAAGGPPRTVKRPPGLTVRIAASTGIGRVRVNRSGNEQRAEGEL